MVRASRESVAYRLDSDVMPETDRFTSGGKKPAAKSAAPKERQKTKKGARIRQKFRLVTPARLFCAIFVAVLCVGMIYSQMRLTQLTNDISKRQSTLEELDSAHVALLSKYEQKYSADYIADYAENSLGMVKMSSGQVEYVELSNPGEFEVSQDVATIGGAVGGLVRGFTAILEYLR